MKGIHSIDDELRLGLIRVGRIINQLNICLVPVRRWCLGNVPNRVPKELLHGHEEVRPKEASKGHSTTSERDSRSFLRHLLVQEVGMTSLNTKYVHGYQ